MIEDRLIELAKGATPGPWVADADQVLHADSMALLADIFWGPIDQRERDAAYIAGASPEVILALANVVKAAREEQKIGLMFADTHEATRARMALIDSIAALDALKEEK